MSNSKYIVQNHDGSVAGPFTSKELKQLASNGELSPTSKIRKVGEDRWINARSIPQLEFAERTAPSSTPTPPPRSQANWPEDEPEFAEVSAPPRRPQQSSNAEFEVIPPTPNPTYNPDSPMFKRNTRSDSSTSTTIQEDFWNFDFFIILKFIKVIYVFATIVDVLAPFIIIVKYSKYLDSEIWFYFILWIPISLILTRMSCELLVIPFKIYEAIREK